MAASFWLNPKSRPITLKEIAGYKDYQARIALEELFWGYRGKQVCWKCGVLDKHYKVSTRGQYRCKHCNHTFSVTSGTPFKDRKISYSNLLFVIVAFINSQEGKPALELIRDVKMQYKTAYVLLHKIRDAIQRTVPPGKLTGTVQIDGAHVSGRIRKGRRKKKRDPSVPKRYRQHRSKYPSQAFQFHPNRRIVMVVRQLSTQGKGADRTIVEICRSENARDAEAIAKKWIRRGATVHTDEWTAYGNFKLLGYKHASVNHQVEFSTDDGVSDNQAESYFSRLRHGIWRYHRITPRYMLDYCCEMAWREDVRRRNTLQQLKTLVTRVFGAGPSSDWRGYWQGNNRPMELLFSATAPS